MGEVSKIQALRCLQISQDVKMIKEFTPFLLSFLTLRIILANQLANEPLLLRGIAPPTSSGDL
jgi:hypothetical protein